MTDTLNDRALRIINDLRGVMEWCGFNQNARLAEAIEVIEAQQKLISDEQKRHAELLTAAQAVFDSSESGTKPPIMAALRKLAAVMGLEVTK